MTATLTNTVTIGEGDQFTSKGNIGVGTYTISNAATSATSVPLGSLPWAPPRPRLQ